MLFVVSPAAMVGFIWASPILIFAVTVGAEYAAGVHFFGLPRSRRNAAAIAVANVPSVAWAIIATLSLSSRSLAGGA